MILYRCNSYTISMIRHGITRLSAIEEGQFQRVSVQSTFSIAKVINDSAFPR